MGLAAGRGEETHGDAVAKPPKSGIARKATEAVGARGLARFGDAETCVRSRLAPPSRRPAIYPSTAKKPGGPENGGFDTRASDAPRRVSGFCGWGVGASRASRSFVARGRISGAGEARVSGLGLAGHCGSRLEPKIFFYHVLAAGMAHGNASASLAGSVARCREERGFRLTEKSIGHFPNLINRLRL